MTSFQQHVIQEIEELLNPPAHHERVDLLHHVIQQIRSNITSAFSNNINQLQLNKQSLLQQVDSVHAYYLQKLQADAEQLAEIKGKLGHLLDLVQDKQAKECESFTVYTNSIFKALHTLMEDKDLHVPSISSVDADGEDRQVFNVIGQYDCPVTSGSDLGSDQSWCFAESIESASPAEPLDCESCAGIPLDVEDLSKNLCLIEKFIQNPVMSLNDVCLANEVCGSISECVNSQPCNGDYQMPSEENPYVAAIDHALRSIILQGSTVKEEKQPDVSLQEGRDYSYQPIQQVVSLQNEIDRIVAGEIKSHCRSEPPRVPSVAPWSANMLAAEIAEIVQSPIPFDQVEEPNTHVVGLVSQIDAIVSAESFQSENSFLTATKGTDAFMPDDFYLKSNHPESVSDPTVKATLALSKILADCSISSNSPLRPSDQTKTCEEMEDNNFVLKGKSMSIVEEVHGLVTEILNS